MNQKLFFIALLCNILTPIYIKSGIAISMELTYEFNSLFQLGELSVKEFKVVPSENTHSVSASDLILFATASTAKNIALQAAIITRKDPEKIDLLHKQCNYSRYKLNATKLNNEQIELKIKEDNAKEEALRQAINQNTTLTRNGLSRLLKTHNKKDDDNDYL